MTNTRWDLTAETKALIVVDMQNGFLKPDGFMVKAGLNIDQCIAAIGPNQSVIAACREEGIPVIYTRYSLRPDYKDAGLLTSLYPGFEIHQRDGHRHARLGDCRRAKADGRRYHC